MENIGLFRGVIDTPVLDFLWHLPWVSKPGWIPFACFLTCVIFRFTSGVIPADCMEVSMAAEPFWSTYLQTCPQALVEVQGSNPWLSMPHAACRVLCTALPLRLGWGFILFFFTIWLNWSCSLNIIFWPIWRRFLIKHKLGFHNIYQCNFVEAANITLYCTILRVYFSPQGPVMGFLHSQWYPLPAIRDWFPASDWYNLTTHCHHPKCFTWLQSQFHYKLHPTHHLFNERQYPWQICLNNFFCVTFSVAAVGPLIWLIYLHHAW